MAAISSLRRPPITGWSLSKSLIFKWSSRIRAIKKRKQKKKKKSPSPPPPVVNEQEALRRFWLMWRTEPRPFIEHLPETPTLEFEADYYCCEFPQELLREILVRLPSVDSIIKCTSVCKSWRSVIKSPTFIDAHLSRRRSLNRNQHRNGDDEDASLLLLERGGRASKSYDLYWDKPSACGLGGEFFPINETNCNSLVTPLVFKSVTGNKELVSYFKLAGTCNGLLCLTDDGDCYYRVPTIICNPLLRKFVALPRPSIALPQECWAGCSPIQLISVLGYDPWTNDYKVLRLSMDACWGPEGREDTEWGAELYSLARDSWKTLSPLGPADFPFPGMLDRIFHTWELHVRHVFCNAAVHWLLTAFGRIETVIASFDMVTESFQQIEVPQALRSLDPTVFLSIHEENSLALIEVDRKRPFCHLHLWVMREYGMGASWTKLYSVRLGNIYQYPHSAPYPCLFGFKSNGEEQVFRMDYRSPSHHHTVLLKVDFKTKQVNTGLVDPPPDYDDFMGSFVESLVLLDQSNALSY